MTNMCQTRRAITLVELLVVLSIMGTLAGIVAMFGPRMMQQSRVPDGARQLQSWLQIARQRAIRDQAPRGLRILDTGNELSHFAYVEQPDDITGSLSQPIGFNPSPYSVNDVLYISTKDVSSLVTTLQNKAAKNAFYADVIKVDAEPAFTIYDCKQVSPTSCYIVTHYFAFNPSKFPAEYPANLYGRGFSIVRGMQPIAGEPELTMPQDVAIDLSRCVLGTSVGGGGGVFDLPFDQQGEVTGIAGQRGRIILWVRDVSLGDPGPNKMPLGDNRLIAIHCRTGQVTAHPVYPEVDSNGNLLKPYKYVFDGKSSATE